MKLALVANQLLDLSGNPGSSSCHRSKTNSRLALAGEPVAASGFMARKLCHALKHLDHAKQAQIEAVVTSL